jgi:hypothetical protein
MNTFVKSGYAKNNGDANGYRYNNGQCLQFTVEQAFPN